MLRVEWKLQGGSYNDWVAVYGAVSEHDSMSKKRGIEMALNLLEEV